MRLFRYIFITILSCILYSCSNDNEITNIDQGYNFYPLEIGNEWIYDAEVISYQLSAIDTSYFQIKELVYAPYIFEEEEGYILHRYSRPDSTFDWVRDSVWSIQKNTEGVVKNENGKRYQKIEFPTYLKRNWDGNQWNADDVQNFEIMTIDSSVIIQGTTYNEVMKIDQGTVVNLIEEKENFDLYSRNIGLILMIRKNLETQPGQRILGTLRTQTLNSINF